MSATKVAPHTCQHAGQDKLHGKGMRVWNSMTKDTAWRCTVCGEKKG